MNRVLIVAFDGMDKRIIEEECSTLKKGEFSTIDNKTGIYKVYTSELFASFITGETWEEHGVKALKKWDKTWIDNLEDKLEGNNFFLQFEGVRRAFYEQIFNSTYRKYFKDDLEKDTIFEKVSESSALFVPSYTTSWMWMSDADLIPLQRGASIEQTRRNWKDKEFNCRKSKLFEEIEDEDKNLIMCHFHYTDTVGHLYGDSYDSSKIREVYREIDQLAEQIKRKAIDNGFDTVIFMSDHGLADDEEREGHNKNAFYSCNKELFGDKTPHITDFHDKILELIGQEKEINGVDL